MVGKRVPPAYIYLNVYGRSFGLATRSNCIANELRKELNYFLSSSGDNNAQIHLDVRDLFRELRGIKPSPGLISLIMLKIMESFHDEYLFFHGSVVVKDDKAIAFIGSSMSGKSTLAILAALSGYEVLSDEVVMVKKGSIDVRAFPLPVTVRENTRSYLEIKHKWTIEGNNILIWPSVGRGTLRKIFTLEPSLTEPICLYKNFYNNAFYGRQDAYLKCVEVAKRYNAEVLEGLRIESIDGIEEASQLLENRLLKSEY